MSSTSIKSTEHQQFVLLVRPLPGVDATRALRWALKGLLRQCGLRCISATEEHQMPSTNLFDEPTLIGTKVKLDRAIDRERPCCRNICTIGAARGPHAAELVCSDCGQHRGWLSKSTAQWIETVLTRFGAPTTPIVVRKAHTFTEEAPPTEPIPL
jgi:hypothetical protein